jgi:metal-dependent amidase/aminoacylase/carboxypeptidase family protein
VNVAADAGASVGKEMAGAAIDADAEGLDFLAGDIWANPEVGYEEEYAHERICSFLEARGFPVQRAYLGIKTAFRTEFRVGDGPTIGIMAEYDALPGIGHACGHNLICEAGVAAFLGTHAALQAGECSGRVVLFGTPAEEQQGGTHAAACSGSVAVADCTLP